MSFEKIVREYAKDSDTEDMNRLTHKIDWFTEKVREKDPVLVDHFLMKVDLLLNPHFTKETAGYAVSMMKNKDGTMGEHWNYDETTSVLRDSKLPFEEADWYYTLNMIYSDYYKSDKSTKNYVEMASDFLSDMDAPECKAKKYYLAMHY